MWNTLFFFILCLKFCIFYSDFCADLCYNKIIEEERKTSKKTEESEEKKMVRINDRAVGKLAASILLNVFEDLASEERTQYVYAAFFESDYCKSLFACAGVVYDKFVINARIAQRPRTIGMKDTETYSQPVYVRNSKGGREKFWFVVDHGYITRIERNGITYRLKHRREHDNSEKEYECSYIMHRAIDALHGGLYYLVEGV